MEKIKKKDEFKGRVPAPAFIRRFSLAFNRRLHDLANQMQDRSERLSVGSKKVLLAVFMLVFGGASLAIIWASIGVKHGSTAISVHSIIPCPLQDGSDQVRPLSPSGGVSKREYEVVRAFHHYLDSLSASSSGMVLRDSILRQRPGLLDSIEVIERMYLEK